MMKRPKSFLLSRLSNDLLTNIIPDFFELCAESGVIRKVSAGALVAAQGSVRDELGIILSGSLRYKKTEDESQSPFSKHTQAFALNSLMHSGPLPSDLYARVDTQILNIPKAEFLKHLDMYPQVRHFLAFFSKFSALSKVLAFLIDEGVSYPDIVDFFSHFKSRELYLGAGQKLEILEPSLWILCEGEIQPASKNNVADETQFNLLKHGDLFGTEAIPAPYRNGRNYFSVHKSVILAAPLKDLQNFLLKISLTDRLIEYGNSQSQRRTVALPQWPIDSFPGSAVTMKDLFSLQPALGAKEFRYSRPEGSAFDSIYNWIQTMAPPIPADSVEVEIAQRGFSYLTLSRAIEAFGLMGTAKKCTLHELARQKSPTLIPLGSRFTLFCGKRGPDCYLLDSQQGPWKIAKDDFEKIWNAEAFFVQPSLVDTLPPSAWRPLKIIYELQKRHAGSLSQVWLLQVLAFTLTLSLPRIAGITIEWAQSGESVTTIGLTLLLGLALFITSRGLLWSSEKKIFVMQEAGEVETQATFLHCLGRMKPSVGMNVGSLSIFENEFRRLSGFALDCVTRLGPDIICALGLTLVLTRYDMRISVIALLAAGVLCLFRMMASGFQRSQYERQMSLDMGVHQKASEFIDGIATIKALAGEESARAQIDHLYLKRWHSLAKSEYIRIATETATTFLSAGILISTLWLTAQAYLSQRLTLAEVITTNGLAVFLTDYVKRIVEQISHIDQIKAANVRLNEFFKNPAHAPQGDGGRINTPLSGKIEMQKLSFRYPKANTAAVNNVNLTVYPGQIVAVVGLSGSGKSTLGKLIAGQLVPSHGRILLDGFDLASLSYECRTREIGLVQQKHELFSGTIASNVSYGSDNFEEEVVEKSLGLAGAEFVYSLPNGTQYHLAESGTGLSQGEKQRVSLARSIFQNPQIFIFDEATSALDAANELLFTANLRQILAGKTAFLIAHRFTTIRAAERIIVMDQGNIVEDGTHEELLEKRGLYYDLFGERNSLTPSFSSEHSP